MPTTRKTKFILVTLLVVVAAGIAWATWPTRTDEVTRIRVIKMRSPDGQPPPLIRYDVWLSDGRSKVFVDLEPLGSLNSVSVDPGSRQPRVYRYRNDPASMSRTDHGPDDEILPIDDEDFAKVKAAVARKIDIDKLKWKVLGETTDRDNKVTEGMIETFEKVIDIP